MRELPCRRRGRVTRNARRPRRATRYLRRRFTERRRMARCCTGLFTRPSTPGPWPAVLVIHGGGFNDGSPDSSSESVTCAQDLAAAGYIAFSIEYRLAPPGALPGQTSDGRFPDQSDDVKLAVRTARPIHAVTGRSARLVDRPAVIRLPLTSLPERRETTASMSGSVFRARTTFRISARIPHLALLYRHGDELC